MIVSLAAALIAVGTLGIVAMFSQMNTVRNILLTLGVVIFVLFSWLMWRRNVAGVMGESSRNQEMLNGYLFLSPNLIGFLLFFAGPLLLSLYVSFTDADGFGAQNWIRLANYVEIFSLKIVPLEFPDQALKQCFGYYRYDDLPGSPFWVRVSLLAQWINSSGSRCGIRGICTHSCTFECDSCTFPCKCAQQ